MNFHILTLFPEMIEQGLNTSITGRAISNGLLSIEAINIRDYAFNKHQSVVIIPMVAEPVLMRQNRSIWHMKLSEKDR